MVHRSRNAGRAMVFAMALIGGMASAAAPGGAHGGDGTLEVGEPEVVGPLEIEFPIRVTYVDDGHAAEEVEGLTVTGKAPDGSSVGPLEAFTPGDAPGVHVARLALPVPGSWELTIEVVEPPARASLTVVVAGDESDVADTTTTSAATDPPDAPSDTGSTDTTEARVGEITFLGSDTAADDDGSFPLVAVVLVGLVAAATLGFIVYRASPGRRTDGEP